MNYSIDVRDLPEEEVKVIQKLVALLREKAKLKKAEVEEKEVEEIALAAHPSDVIGNLTRREIYDHI